MFILGISAYYHDSAAVLLGDGRILAAAQEERFSRVKHDARFPHQALDYCLEAAGIDMDDIEHIVFYDKPFLKFERLLETYFAFVPAGFWGFKTGLPIWVKEKLFLKDLLAKELKIAGAEKNIVERIRFSEHHLSHAASAFYPSPFEDAAILTVDGVGEWASTSISHGSGTEIKRMQELHFPHSLGLLYSAFTYYCGFKVNSGEYKLMGLAPYGKSIYADRIRHQLMEIKEDGSFALDMQYFGFATGSRMTNRKFDALFEGRPRKPKEDITEYYKDMAASVQLVCEDLMLGMARHAIEITGSNNLVLAGGVALNCVANASLREALPDTGIWVQPAAGDAGGALGAALALHYSFEQSTREIQLPDGMQQCLLGPAFDDESIEEALKAVDAVYSRPDNLYETVAELLADGQVVGRFAGRMEFGPRALGSRSILADARIPDMQEKLNLKIKFREGFRPFAPAVMEEYAGEYFDPAVASPHMMFTASVKSDAFPSITHVDGSARVQTVDRAQHPEFWELLEAFRQKTGCAMLINTSFNVRGEPPVCTPADAWRCFMGTEMDVLSIGPYLLLKAEQKALTFAHAQTFEAD